MKNKNAPEEKIVSEQENSSPTKIPTLVLLDVHAIIHRAYHALPDFRSSKGEPTGALYGVVTMLIKIIEDVQPDYIVACYDLPQPTHRHEVYKDYKAGRKKTDDDLALQMQRSRDIFTAWSIPMYDKPGFEADDMLGTITEILKDAPINIVIASGDMDTLQLVSGKRVQVYTLKKGIKDTIMYDEAAVRERFGFGPEQLTDYKGLRGDTSDNIIGIKGIGEKTGATLIQNFGTIEKMYKELKKDKEAFTAHCKTIGITPRIVGLIEAGEEEALFSKTLATIRRDAPISFVMPATWKEAISLADIEKLFSELEFRALTERVRTAVSGKKAAQAGLDDDGMTSVSEAENRVNSREKIDDLDPQLVHDTAVALWVADSNITNPNLDEIYNFSGAFSFAEARTKILEEVEKRGSMSVLNDIERPLIPVLERMKTVGIKVDVEYLQKLGATYHAELSKIEKTIWDLAGENFNIASPKQLGEIIFNKLGLKAKNQKKTGTGALSTKESELEKLRDAHPIINEVFKYREYSKLLSTYIDVIPTLVDEHSRIHSTLIQAGTTTGRMASENPNIQNIPNKSDLGRAIRSGFISEKGKAIVAIDYSQMELRIAAFLSRDEKLIEIFREGRDVHTAVAAQVFKVEPEQVTKDMRRQAKVINFGVMYGMGVNALRQNLGSTREEAQLFYNEYFATFSGLAQYLNDTKVLATKKGYTETLFGRRRYFAGLSSKIPYIKASAERMAINAPIQGTEADIIKLAMIRIDEYIRAEKLEGVAHMLIQVHDELVFEIDEKRLDIVPQLQKIMESVIDTKITHGVVCTTEARYGKNWEDTQPLIQK